MNQPDLTPEEAEILAVCAARMAEIAARRLPPNATRWQRLDLDGLRRFGPPYSPADWFGDGRPLPEKHRQRYRRAVAALAARGLLVESAYRDRLAAVRLTPAGERAAASLVAPGSTIAPGAGPDLTPAPDGP